jgi:hypothetical protein
VEGFGWTCCKLELAFDEAGSRKCLHSLYGHRTTVLDNDLVHFGVAGKIKVIMNSTSRMNVGMSAIAATSSLSTR